MINVGKEKEEKEEKEEKAVVAKHAAVKLKYGDFIFSLNLNTQMITVEETKREKIKNKRGNYHVYLIKKDHFYCVAKTRQAAQNKLTEQVARAIKAGALKAVYENENNGEHSDTGK